MSDDLVMACLERKLPKVDFIPLPDVAVALDVSSGTVLDWVEEGKLAGVNMGSGSKRYLKLHRESLLSFLRCNAFGPGAPPMAAAAHRQMDLFPASGTGGATKKEGV